MRQSAKKAHKQRMEALHAEARRIVASNVCPQCGAGIRRNLSLTGWYQCEQYGTTGFRKDSSKPSCSFQTFTD